MALETRFINNLYLRRFVAGVVDFGIEMGGALLGGYFGAMMGALLIVIRHVSPEATQKAIWTGMVFGFVFWGAAASWMNRVLVQGMSRASVGKKLMDLEIVSTGNPITWEVMMKRWISIGFVGDISVVSSLDQSNLAPVISIQSKPAPQVAPAADTADTQSDKKAA